MKNMHATSSAGLNKERPVRVVCGWIMLPVVILMILGGIATLILSIALGVETMGHPHWWMLVAGVLTEIAGLTCLGGFFTLQPNEARVLILFGAYRGTVRESGFHWGNPFYANGNLLQVTPAAHNAHNAGNGPTVTRKPGNRYKVSLRARTLNGQRLKVNDKRGNPVEIAAVVIWRVADTAQAMFDVDNYEGYVETQSESSLRHLASAYAYDNGEENESTLRSNVEDVSQALKVELEVRLAKAGVVVEEARLTHLAYAPEIAQAMLRRQQAEAVIAARQKIVHGAVSMVEMALRELAEKNVLTLDDDRKAAMVSNLMVVLCGEAEVHPVVNTGTLYS
jgi:regulator of protease activity HflC (stomatin/prohibitin superfamily)